MHRFSTRAACAATLLFGIVDVAAADDMRAVYDAAAAGEDVVKAPGGVVAVDVDLGTPLLTIPQHFYGVNIHPIPASKAFARPELARALKPDVVRIRGNSPTHWERDASGNSQAIRWTIRPRPGPVRLERARRALGGDPGHHPRMSAYGCR